MSKFIKLYIYIYKDIKNILYFDISNHCINLNLKKKIVFELRTFWSRTQA
jgi:hypothetical protein